MAVRGRWIVFVIALLAAVPACTSDTRSGAQHHHIEINGFVYTPAELRLSVGDTITWTNRDFVPHTATAVGGDWDTGTIASGDSATVVLTDGAGEYLCTFHPNMRGRLEAM